MARIFHNPVAVHSANLDFLPELLEGRPYVLVTSSGWTRRGAVSRIVERCRGPLAVIDSIGENPTIEQLVALEERISPFRGRELAVIALGGGSVMDAAKAVRLGLSPNADMVTVETAVREAKELSEDLPLPTLICIPTTAGTGSEVTNTASIWCGRDRAKYSIEYARLFATAAILDPTLTTTMPADLTLSAGLDILSHAMEAIWNVHHNEVSDAFATSAIARVKRSLPRALNGGDLAVRAELQYAATLGGFAISATRTALAHSISYPLTSLFGLRHGLACSFTLPEVAAYNLATHYDRIQLIADAFGVASAEELPAALRSWIGGLGVYDIVRRFVDLPALLPLGVKVITPGRADNNIRPATAADAHAVLYSALDEKMWSHPKPRPSAGCVVWITGLSGAGKSTLAREVVSAMRASNRKVVLLDGDELRGVVSGHVGHTAAERRALAQRYSSLCRFLAFQGIDVVCATMSLFREVQEWNRKNIPDYIEVYLKTDMHVLIERDTKGLYRRKEPQAPGEVVGLDQAYDEPATPDLVIDNSVDRSDMMPLVTQVLALLPARK